MITQQIPQSDIQVDPNKHYLCKVLGHWSAGTFISYPDGTYFTGYTGKTPLQWISEIYAILE